MHCKFEFSRCTKYVPNHGIENVEGFQINYMWRQGFSKLCEQSFYILCTHCRSERRNLHAKARIVFLQTSQRRRGEEGQSLQSPRLQRELVMSSSFLLSSNKCDQKSINVIYASCTHHRHTCRDIYDECVDKHRQHDPIYKTHQ